MCVIIIHNGAEIVITIDSKGRPITNFNGTQISNNFN